MHNFIRINEGLDESVECNVTFINLALVREINFYKSDREEYIEFEYRGQLNERETRMIRVSHDSEDASTLRRFLDENRLNQKSC